jgi:hypothetical protein
MDTEELTSIATAHQNAISRHDQEMAEIRAVLQQSVLHHRGQDDRLTRIETILEATVAQQRDQGDRLTRIETILEATAAQQCQNVQGIAELRASITELRSVVADYIQGRTQIE